MSLVVTHVLAPILTRLGWDSSQESACKLWNGRNDRSGKLNVSSGVLGRNDGSVDECTRIIILVQEFQRMLMCVTPSIVVLV